MLNCLIIDDEPLARQQIAAYVVKVPFLKLIGTARNTQIAQEILKQEAVDLLFLDIQMPRQTGIEFLKQQKVFQQVIFITAFAEFAIDGFELEVTDYLMKPVTFERFLKACEKAQARVLGTDTVKKVRERPDSIYVKCDQRFEKIALSDIMYIEAMLNYVHLVLPDRKCTIYSSLKAIEEQLPKNQFLRIHKSYLISLAHVAAFDQHHVRIGTRHLPVSRSHKQAILDLVLNFKGSV